MEQKLSEEKIRANLKDAGCDESQIANFLKLHDHTNRDEQLRLLRCHRCQLIESLHIAQKKIDCLDYLIYMLKQDK